MAPVVQYDMRTLLGMVEYSGRPSTFLLDMIMGGSAPITHDTKYIEVDVVKGSETAAAYVARQDDPEDVQKDGYESKIHLIPYTKQRLRIGVEDLENRTPGNTIYESGTPAGRRDELVAKNFSKLEDRIVRLEEIQVSQTLATGTCVVTGRGGLNYTVTYGRDSGNTVTLLAGDRWSEASTRDIRGDFRAVGTQMRLPTVQGGSPTIAVMGENAGNNYISDQAVQGGLLDLRRVQMGEINVEYLASLGVTYVGRHVDAGITVDIYIYHKSYTNSSGVTTPYIDTDDVYFFRRGMMSAMHYSMIYNMRSSFVGRRFPLQWVTDDGSAMVIQLESGPLMAVHEINATYCLHTNG